MISLFLSFIFSALLQDQAQAAQRFVEIQWEDQPGAVKFIIEVQHPNGQLLKTITSQTALIKFWVPIGNFKMRGRVVSQTGKLGDWSQLSELSVPPQAVAWKKNKSKIIKQIPSPKTRLASFSLAWPGEKSAQSYKVKIYDQNKKLVKQDKAEQAKLNIDLEPGEYTYSVTSMNGEELSSEEVFAPQVLQVGKAQLAPIDFIESAIDGKAKFSWQFEPGLVYRYNLEYSPFLAKDWKLLNAAESIAGKEWSPDKDLRPGRYRWSLWAEADGWLPAPPKNFEFVIKPTLKQLENSKL